ncbi:MAG TPA: protein phosphatase 2C domain-containing protein [Pyrinomonadaceae bacterium]|nr:protein phosphatase 2C domain-containing protein [Pyrinomonadaceae bacterium]
MSSVKQSVTWDLVTRQLLLPKLGHEPSECEDAIAVDTQNCRFAVADGATEAFDARNWAQRLAQKWVQNQSASTLEEFREWVAAEGRELRDSWSGLSLSWYSEEKARTGSFAALVGVELDLKTDEASWKAIALGDTCLLHLRQGTLLKSLPLCRSESFSSAPVLVASDSSMHEACMKSVVIDSGSCESGDVLLLLSDGVASWYLERFERQEYMPSDFFETKEDDELKQFFDDERLAGRMRNDDVAVLRIEITRRMS